MKKLFILLVLVAGIPSTYARMAANPPVTTDGTNITVPMVLQNDTVPTVSQDNVLLMTSQNNPLSLFAEDEYIDSALYVKLESSKMEALKKQLAKYSDEKLLATLPIIDKKISMVKLSRIARESQIKTITLYFFVKNNIPNVIASRSASVSWKKPGIENISYSIDGQVVKLTDGIAEKSSLSGSTSKAVTQLLGNTSLGDLNGDGTLDAAFILTQSTSGSGLFYYAAVALMTDKGYVGTNAVFLGDRITPISTEIKDGKVIVNYSDRKTGEAMTIAPTVATSKYLKVSGTTLAEITK